MRTDKKPRIVCITGASSGIGRELTIQLIKSGHTVIGIARRKDFLEGLATELNNKNFYYYTVDVSNSNELTKIKNELIYKKLLPDTIICAASIYEKDTEPTYNNSLVRKTIEINFFGTANMVDSFLPEFLKINQGHFITLSSIASWRPNMRGVAYPASKAAVSLFFRGLDLKYKTLGITFSTIYLGPIDTSMWEGKRSFLVVTPEKIAGDIIKRINDPKPVSYMPFISTTLSRLSALIPDKLYAKLSSYLLK